MPPVPVRAAAPAELGAAGAVVARAYRADGIGDEAYLAYVADAASRVGDGEVLVALDGEGCVAGSVTYDRHGSPLAELSASGEAEFRMLGAELRGYALVLR